ncbi:unnamed protein product [Symbiodinium necroappetens]|uniref:SMB domain-containing protein n=1 Tax=Symbiodinium necroappetens TaxID=1628268 RepID=A0A812R6Z2_9DINO|nr:unnamed protein product [Symbiodinium necroappetens]
MAMSRTTLALSAWLCLVLSQTVRGDLNTQVSRNLRQGNQSAGNPNRSSSQEGSAGLKVRKANQTGRANDSLATKADFHEPLLLPPNVSGQDAPHSAEAGASPSNATAFRPSFKSAAGWTGGVGCWHYGCRSSYHPEFQCQCNKDCGRFRNCCYDYGTCWQTPDSRRRRRRDPSSSNSRPTHTNMVTGFHQTSPNVCKLIVNSAFRPGSDGHCGGAIYFALSPQATKTKAIGNDSKSGCMIEAKVDVGRVKYEGPRCGHKWTKQEFLQTGYDSIRFDPGDGDELVIYDSWRVKSMRIIPFNDAWRPTYNVR